MLLALEGRDYDLEEAGSGEDVLARLREGARWDVAVLDHRLPGIDGVQTLEGIREIDSECTVLMVTAFASVDLAVEAMKLGARDFVQKPMTPETLRAAVGAALSKARGEWVPPPTPLVPTHRAWEVWTMNGFYIVDACNPVSEVEHRQEIVEGRDGPRHPVTVRFAPRVVEEASAESGRALAADSRF
jgi:DNA-binding response OmpR family regulator